MPLRNPIEKLECRPRIELGFENLRYLMGGESWDEGFDVRAAVPVRVFAQEIADLADCNRRGVIIFPGDWRVVELGRWGEEPEAPQMGDGVLEVIEKWGFEEIAGREGEGFFHYHWRRKWDFGGVFNRLPLKRESCRLAADANGKELSYGF